MFWRHSPANWGTRHDTTNILILMVDQLNGTFFPDGPADWLHTPTLKALAQRSARFANAYTASPLCAPGRASFMSGRLPSRTRVYDNAAEFASDIPTFAHHLRRAGYQTCLVRQDAFRRPRPASRLRGAADDRHLPGRFRLDPRLSQAGGADRLVVSQHGLRDRGGRGRDHQPDGIRRRGGLPRGAEALRSRARSG
jgi:arylsulfatase A-like enzyme